MLSVGVDIGSSTSHLVFSRIVLERLDSRYVVTTRETFYQSDILLDALRRRGGDRRRGARRLHRAQYQNANVDPDEIDTGALILTGVAVRRRNARRIGELFARQAGKMVAVSAGDSLETVMAAHGSGAVARSIRDKATVMNVDVGGGTSKIAICVDGRVTDLTALDVGARLVCLDPAGTNRAGRGGGPPLRRRARHQPRARQPLAPEAARDAGGRHGGRGCSKRCAGDRRPPAARDCCASIRCRPARRSTRSRSRAASPNTSTAAKRRPSAISACCWRRKSATRVRAWGPQLERSNEGIRATVIGASQYTTQVSGSTIYVSPLEALPLRNVPVIAPRFALDADDDRFRPPWRRRSRTVLKRLDLGDADTPVAVFVPWRGSATFQRLDAFCQGWSARLAGDARRSTIRWCWRATATSAASRHSSARGNAARQRHRLGRRPRAQGVRLHRHRRHAADVRRGAGGDQVADLSGERRARHGMAARPRVLGPAGGQE